MKMEVDTKSASLKPLQVLQRFSYSTNLPSWNCLKWSKSNQLVGLNVCDRLLIFQFNIHYAINESTINRRQWCEDNLKFSVVTIYPEHEFQFNVGHLENIEQSYRQGYMKPNPRMARSEFIYFDFSPSSPFRSYNVLGAITADYVFQLYLQYNSQPWKCICNLSQHLNTYYTENKWNSLEQEKISFSEHCQRLDSLSITCFCFDSANLLRNDCAEYALCTATKTGDIVFWNISISSSEEDGTPKCDAKIEQIVPSGLQEIVTLQIIGDNWLLVEAACGKAVLFDLAKEDTLSRSVSLWDEADYLPCYNFCFTQLQNGSTEIVFHKVQRVIRVNVTADFKLKSAQKYLLEDNTELLAIYNYSGNYCATQYNTPYVWMIDFAESSLSSGRLLLQSQIKFNCFAFNRNSSVYDIAFSQNQTIVAFVGNINTFSSQSSVLKNVELIFCAKEDAEFACNFVQESLASYSNISSNLTDCLYLIRYHLFHKTNFEASLKQLLQFILNEYEDLNSVLNASDREPKHLLRLLKTVRFIVCRFEELSLMSPETNLIDDSTLQRVRKLRSQLDQCLRKLTTEEVLSFLLKGDLKDGSASRLTALFTGEQMVSLYKINLQMPLNKVYKTVLDQVNKLVQSRAKNAFTGIRSSFGADFSSDNPSRNKCLLNLLNRCPHCGNVPIRVTPDDVHCPEHQQLDICANSLLIADPWQNDLDLCTSCFESKLISPRLWPSQSTSPFHYAYDRCLFCL